MRYVGSWPKRNGERGKVTVPLAYMAKTKLSGSLLLLAARDCES
jgi:hypothetical protein